MAKYRHDLPQRQGGIFLTDGGMETTLIFHEGIELPHFAAFVLLDSPEGPAETEAVLRQLSRGRARPWRRASCSTAPTWRANPDWGAKLDYDAAALKAINVRSIAFLEELRAGWERPAARLASSAAPSARAATATRQATWRPMKPRPIMGRRSRPSSRAVPTWSRPIRSTASMKAIGVARAAKAHGMPCRHLVHGGDRRPARRRRDACARRSRPWIARPTARRNIL